MHFTHTSRVVVGVDGSARSRDAVTWAVEQVRGTNAAVELVHAWRIPVEVAVATREKLPAAVSVTGEVGAALDEAHEVELDAAREQEQAIKDAHERKAIRLLERVRDTALPDSDDRAQVHLVPLEGDAGPTLVHHAEGADLLVVSSHRTTRIGATVLGSVSLYCALHAACPVVVLPITRRRRTSRTVRPQAAQFA